MALKLKNKKINLLTTLAVAVFAMLVTVSTASGAAREMDNADGATLEVVNNDTIINAANDAANFVGADIEGNIAVATIDIDHDGLITVTDSGATAHTMTIGTIDILATKTLTIVGGDVKSDGTGTDTVADYTIATTGVVGGTVSSLTRGGNLVMKTAPGVAHVATITFAGHMKLATATFQAGSGGTQAGGAIAATLGNAAADNIDFTTFNVIGGAGTGQIGGATVVTVTGTLVDASGGINVTAGASASTAVGGVATLVVTPAITAQTGAITITGGVGVGAGDGGAAKMTLSGGITGMTAAATVTAGGGGTAGLSGDAEIEVETAYTSTSTLSAQGGNGGNATGKNGGAATLDLNGTVNVLGLSAIGGNGTTTGVTGVGGAATIDLEGVGIVGASGLTITGGNGGSHATAAAAGGASDINAADAFTSTGAINITGGNGGTNTADNGGTAAAVFVGAVTATAQTMTITGGNGSGTAADGGNAAVTLTAGTNAFTSIVLDDGSAGTGVAGTATLNVIGSAAVVVNGAITAAADNEGAIVINNSGGNTPDVTFGGQIGTSAKAMKTLTLTAGDGTFSGDVYAKVIANANGHDFDFDGDVVAATSLTLNNQAQNTVKGDITAGSIVVAGAAGGMTFDGVGDQAITGAMTNGTANWITLTNNNTAGIVTIASAVAVTGTKAGSLLHATGSQTVYKAGVHAQDFDIVGTAKVTLEAAMTLTDKFDTNDGNTLTLGSAFVGGTTAITADNSANDLDQTVGAVTVKMNSKFVTGTLTLLDDATDTLDANDVAAFAVTDTAIIDYTIAVNGGDLEITAAAKTAAATASELGITKAAASGLSNANTAAAGDETIRNLMSAILNTGGAAATKMAQQVQGSPDGLGATSGAATASTGAAAISVGSSRMAALRSGTAYASLQGTGFNAGSGQSNDAYASTFGTGFSAGSGTTSNSMWMKPFVSFGDQQMRKGIAGYKADTYGLAIGGDKKITENSVAGLSVSYAQTDVDGKGAGNSHSDIASYQVTAYADYTRNDWYVEGLVGYAYNDLKTTRTISVTDAKAKGDTDSGQYMVSLNAGMPMKIDGDSGAYFTPTIGVNVTHVDNKEYTETGAGVLNLKINPEDITLAKASLGGRLHTSLDSSDGIFVPELRVKLLYDMAGDDGSSTNTFTGGGAAFQVDGLDVVEFSSSVGLGLAFSPNDIAMEGMSFSVNYDAEMKEDFMGQSGNFSFRYAF